MGYQQSLIRFDSDENLKKELNKYFITDGNKDDAKVYAVLRCVKEINELNFKVGDLFVIIGGERYAQRSPYRLQEYLGLQNVEEVIFIDGEEIWELSEGNISDFLDEHLEYLSQEEQDELFYA